MICMLKKSNDRKHKSLVEGETNGVELEYEVSRSI